MRSALAVLLVAATLAGCTSPRPDATPTRTHPGTAPAARSALRPAPTHSPTAPAVRPSPTPSTRPSPPPSTRSSPAPSRSARPTPSSAAPRGLPSIIGSVTAAELRASWHPGCPVSPAGLRLIRVGYLGFDGRAHTGQLVVAATVAEQVVAIFAEIYAARFPIRQLVPTSAYGGNDERSMEADNSSAFNCRAITGGGGWSKHAYGTAIDINTLENPYVSASGIEPTTAGRFTDRGLTARGMIHPGDAIVAIFARYGWKWGGDWHEPTDYQHFEK